MKKAIAATLLLASSAFVLSLSADSCGGKKLVPPKKTASASCGAKKDCSASEKAACDMKKKECSKTEKAAYTPKEKAAGCCPR